MGLAICRWLVVPLIAVEQLGRQVSGWQVLAFTATLLLGGDDLQLMADASLDGFLVWLSVLARIIWRLGVKNYCGASA